MATTKEKSRPERTADGEAVHSFLCRLPESLHERLRDRSHSDRRPKAEIIRDALTLYLK